MISEEIEKIVAEFVSKHPPVSHSAVMYDMAKEILDLREENAKLEHQIWVASWGVE